MTTTWTAPPVPSDEDLATWSLNRIHGYLWSRRAEVNEVGYTALCRVRGVATTVRDAYWAATKAWYRDWCEQDLTDEQVGSRAFEHLDGFFMTTNKVVPETLVPLSDAICWSHVCDLAPTRSTPDAGKEYLTWRDLTDHGWVYHAAGITPVEARADGLPSLADAYLMATLRGASLPPLPVSLPPLRTPTVPT